MTVVFVQGDPLLTRAQTLAIGHNARGRIELGAFETAAMQAYPAAFAAYTRRARQGQQSAGHLWIWRETLPQLAFCTIRDSAVGATRLRYVQNIFMTLAREGRLYSIQELAIAPMGNRYESAEILGLLDQWLGASSLRVLAYTEYIPGVQAHEGDVE